MIKIAQELEKYLEEHCESEPMILTKIRRETYQKTTQPHMISGLYQGRLLSLLSKMLRPKSILELGTFTGYATLCLAEGLDREGKLITIDNNDELAYLAQKYFEDSFYAQQIDYQIGEALEVLKKYKDRQFDLVFIDADKKNYAVYYDLIIDQVTPGGILLVDNVLWYGKVLEEAKPKDEITKIVQNFNDKIKNDNRVESILLPIRDGISLIRKK